MKRRSANTNFKSQRASAAVTPSVAKSNESKSERPTPAHIGPVTTFPIVGVGASAGGLEAFMQLLNHLPTDTGLGFVLVQHLDPKHESALTQLLTRATSMAVHEVTNNLRVEPNQVYVIPPNTNLTVSKGFLKLEPRPDKRAPARSVDCFFESLAQDQRERAIGVILSGTATDGTLGLEAIKAEGGITFAQDDSAKYDSMPRSAVAAGCVDFVLKPEDIAQELARIARHPYVAGQPLGTLSPEENRASATAHQADGSPLPSGGHGTPSVGGEIAHEEAAAKPTPLADNGFKKIVLLLRSHSGVDFSLYKSTTIQRRIARRAVLNKSNTMEEYATSLRGNTKELDTLYSDVLISVTSFFRNPEAFEFLKRRIFPKFLQQRGDDPVRVWVLGCSTGQEAYSIAMAFVEAGESVARTRKLQVFATDLNEALLEKARHALYSKTLAQDISPERLRRFFVEEEGGYRIIKPLREMVVFARQNFISDPPFSRMDLITCRNLLIYLEPELQKKAIPTFHYALKPGGFLFLGSSESIGDFTDLFEPVDKKHRVYFKKAGPAMTPPFPLKKQPDQKSSQALRPPLPIGKAQDTVPGGEVNAQREADRLMVNRFAPPAVLINADLQILQFRGPTGDYLEPPTGKATFDVLKMAREGLMLPLRSAIYKAKKEHKNVRKEKVSIQQKGGRRLVNIEVIPLKNLKEPSFLVLFEDAEEFRRSEQKERRKETTSPPAKTSRSDSQRIVSLERELAETRDYLQSLQEQHVAAAEELQASNEEIQSANEELQSVNEELETSKEELESSNEELTTVNDEMAHRNAELSRLNADLSNVQSSTKLPILVLGRDLIIRRFSLAAERIFSLLPTDIGRPMSGIRHNLTLPAEGNGRGNVAVSPSFLQEEKAGGSRSMNSFPLEDFIRKVIDTVQEQEHEVRAQDGRWYSLRGRPYTTVDNKIDGAVLVLVDINDLKRAGQQVQQARDYAEATIRTARDPLVILRADLRVDKANDAFYKTFNLTPKKTENVLIYELNGGEWRIPKLRELLEEIILHNTIFNDFEVSHDFEHIGPRTMLLNARRLDNPSGLPERILLGMEDVTERRKGEGALRESEERYRTLFNLGPIAIYSIDASGRIRDFNLRAAELWGRRPALNDTDERFCGSFKMYRPDGSHMPHEECPMAQVVSGRIAVVQDAEVVIERPDGSRITVIVNIRPIRNDTGEVTGAINCFYDITERKRAEKALALAKEQLADRAVQLEHLVAERTARLQDTIGELEHFSYTITHDMRAPLRAMQGYCTLLIDRYSGELRRESSDYLMRIAHAAERMDALIRDSLQYAKVVREKLPLIPVNPASVLRGVMESYPGLQPPDVEIQVVEPLPAIMANEAGLAQCFSNILANAIKFVRPGKVPLVRIWAEPVEPPAPFSPSSSDEGKGEAPPIHRSSPDGSVRFWFADNGIGIPHQYQDRIFRMFQQLDRSYQGTGIGLALVRKTVERMDGTVGVESEPGKGSRFWLEFKKARPNH